MRPPIALLISLLVLGAAAGGSSLAATRLADDPLEAHQDPALGQLLVPGERTTVGFRIDSPGVTAASGALFVRNDLRRTFVRVPLVRERDGSLRGAVPATLARGRKVFSYAVLRDPSSGRSATLPAGGARSPQVSWITKTSFAVTLGTHRFGRLSRPEAVVAEAGPDEVGFPSPGEACCGPSSFDVAPDGAVWLLDGGRQRLVVWDKDQPGAIARTVALPGGCCEDFALRPGGGVYATQSGVPGHRLNFLYRLDATGAVVWRSTLAAEGWPVPLRIGPGGILYSAVGTPGTLAAGIMSWQPATSPAGRPLSVAGQVRGAQRGRPLAGGRRLVTYMRSPYDARFGIVDGHGTLVRSWRVTSRTALEPVPEAAPGLAGDPVVFLGVHTPEPAGAGDLPFEWEYLALRLAPTASGTSARLSLGHRPPLAGWSDTVTDLRVGPDGKLYQLGTSPTAGVQIRRYSLD